MANQDIPTQPSYITVQEFRDGAQDFFDFTDYPSQIGEGVDQEAVDAANAKITRAIITAETLIDSELPFYPKYDENQLRTFPVYDRDYDEGYLPFEVKQAMLYTVASVLQNASTSVSSRKVKSESWNATGYSVVYQGEKESSNGFAIPDMAMSFLNRLSPHSFKLTRE